MYVCVQQHIHLEREREEARVRAVERISYKIYDISGWQVITRRIRRFPASLERLARERGQCLIVVNVSRLYTITIGR